MWPRPLKHGGWILREATPEQVAQKKMVDCIAFSLLEKKNVVLFLMHSISYMGATKAS